MHLLQKRWTSHCLFPLIFLNCYQDIRFIIMCLCWQSFKCENSFLSSSLKYLLQTFCHAFNWLNFHFKESVHSVPEFVILHRTFNDHVYTTRKMACPFWEMKSTHREKKKNHHCIADCVASCMWNGFWVDRNFYFSHSGFWHYWAKFGQVSFLLTLEGFCPLLLHPFHYGPDTWWV